MSKNKRSNQRRKEQQRKKMLRNYGLIGLLAVIAFAMIWQWQQNAPAVVELPLEISVAEAAAERDSGSFILDVREPSEWDEYHIPGSTLIPLGELAARVSELPTDQEIIVVCRSGNRSATGRDILLDAGLSQVTSMAGGVSTWRDSGFPTVSGP